MRIRNVKSVLAFNTVMARFAPSQSGKMAYFVEDDSFTIFAVEKCDVCGCECQGANPITIEKPRQFVIDGLHRRGIFASLITDEGGCDDEGNFVCTSCYMEGKVNEAMLKSEAGLG
jgi:hypothetical protein